MINIQRVTYFYLLTMLFALIFICTQTTSQTISFQSQPVEDSTFARYGLILSYQRFQNAEMKNTYPGVFGIHVGRTEWLWDMVGLRLAGGVTGGEGTPHISDPTWQLNTADLGFWAINLEASVVIRFTGGNPQRSITPFLGVGGEGYGGIEKLSVSITRSDTNVRGDASALRGIVGGHAIVGVYIPLTMENAMQIEMKYLYTLNGGYQDLLSEKDKTEFRQKIYTVVNRPTFSFTGISVGLMFFF